MLLEAAAAGAEQAEQSAEHTPIIVEFVNHYFGEWAYKFEMTYTHPLWTKFFAKFGTTPVAVLILVSNLMGLFPLFMSPTAATSVTFALGISSFLYYNYIGIKENGLLGHLKHLAGPVWWISWLIFPIELISNFIRPFSLGIRLFGNMFADEKVFNTITQLKPPYSSFIIPNLFIVVLFLLSLFVSAVQTFVFILLSQLYLSEVSHAPHEEHEA